MCHLARYGSWTVQRVFASLLALVVADTGALRSTNADKNYVGACPVVVAAGVVAAAADAAASAAGGCFCRQDS